MMELLLVELEKMPQPWPVTLEASSMCSVLVAVSLSPITHALPLPTILAVDSTTTGVFTSPTSTCASIGFHSLLSFTSTALLALSTLVVTTICLSPFCQAMPSALDFT
jgi:hypothetical protein